MKSRQAIEREIVISPEDEPLVHEYGVNGRIWAIEVTPAGAPSYFLVEAGGDGRLRTRPNGLAPALLVPAWEVIRW